VKDLADFGQLMREGGVNMTLRMVHHDPKHKVVNGIARPDL
jgi:hypothetical protein